jgi:capsid portal protein
MTSQNTDVHAARYVANSRNGYKAIDMLRPTAGSGTYGDPLIFARISSPDADRIAAALNAAFAAGVAHASAVRQQDDHPGR